MEVNHERCVGFEVHGATTCGGSQIVLPERAGFSLGAR
jgi:hypothetical protein